MKETMVTRDTHDPRGVEEKGSRDKLTPSMLKDKKNTEHPHVEWRIREQRTKETSRRSGSTRM